MCILNELDVYCPNRSHGCNSTFKNGYMDKHLEKECEYQQVHCTKSKSCGCYLLRKDLEAHLKEECMLCDLCIHCNKLISKDTEHAVCLLKLAGELEEARKRLKESENALNTQILCLSELNKKIETSKENKQIVKCPRCNRRFTGKELKVHKNVCKNKGSKRPVFNSSAKRLKDLIPRFSLSIQN